MLSSRSTPRLMSLLATTSITPTAATQTRATTSTVIQTQRHLRRAARANARSGFGCHRSSVGRECSENGGVGRRRTSEPPRGNSDGVERCHGVASLGSGVHRRRAASQGHSLPLRRASDLCARRLACEIDPEVTRVARTPSRAARLRDAFRDAAIAAQLDGGTTAAAAFRWPPGLEPEEYAVLDQAARWYLRIYGDRDATVDPGRPRRRPRCFPAGRSRSEAWSTSTLVGADGIKEVRQIELWGGREPGDDPLVSPALRLAVLRLAQIRWLAGEPVRVSWCDPVHGIVRERIVDTATELDALGTWLDGRLDVVTRTHGGRRPERHRATTAAGAGSCRAVRRTT